MFIVPLRLRFDLESHFNCHLFWNVPLYISKCQKHIYKTLTCCIQKNSVYELFARTAHNVNSVYRVAQNFLQIIQTFMDFQQIATVHHTNSFPKKKPLQRYKVWNLIISCRNKVDKRKYGYNYDILKISCRSLTYISCMVIKTFCKKLEFQ